MCKPSYTAFEDPFAYKISSFINSSTLDLYNYTVAHYITDSTVILNLIIETM